jgi:ubiquinone/menaquinone biosynthesis C-methylase UbiE
LFIVVLWVAGAVPSHALDPKNTPPPTRPPFAATSNQSFADVEHWQKVFDNPERDKWQRPAEVVKALGLKKGAVVADLGAGTGYFMPYLSAAAGENGTVFAVEPEPKLVEHLRERAEKTGAANVVPVLASLDNPRLPASSIDVVLIVDTFHHIDDRLAYMRRLRRVLRSSGRVAIVDWFKRPLPEGPPPEHKIDRDQVVTEMEAAGYRLVEEPRVLEYQYFLIFR